MGDVCHLRSRREAGGMVLFLQPRYLTPDAAIAQLCGFVSLGFSDSRQCSLLEECLAVGPLDYWTLGSRGKEPLWSIGLCFLPPTGLRSLSRLPFCRPTTPSLCCTASHTSFTLFYLMFCLHVCLYYLCVYGAHGDQKRISNPLEQKSQVVMSHHVSAQTQTSIL